MKKSLLLLFLLSIGASQTISSEHFRPGEGAKYHLKMNQKVSELSIYITQVTEKTISVEYFFSSSGLFAAQLWQQFQMKFTSNGPLQIKQGHIQSPEMKFPEKMTRDFFNQKKSMDLNLFLISSKEQLKRYKVSESKVRVPAGEVQAIHYRKKDNGQIIDFWISHAVKPISLVKLISLHPKELGKNYTIELQTLLKNVQAKIDPSKSVPLTDKGRDLLPKS